MVMMCQWVGRLLAEVSPERSQRDILVPQLRYWLSLLSRSERVVVCSLLRQSVKDARLHQVKGIRVYE